VPAYLTIVQCVPDPVIDERINVGVIVYGDGRIRSRFVSDWKRVRSFGVEDVEFLKDFADRLQHAGTGQGVLPGMPGVARFDESALERIVGSWSNAIQFTEPRGSLRDPDTVLEDAAKRFLREHVPSRRVIRTRATAAALARETVERGFKGLLDQRKVEQLVRKNPELPGKLDDHHRIDVAVGNGNWRFAAHGLSFELHDFDQLESDYSRAAFAVSDIVQRIHDLKFAVLLLPPTQDATPKICRLYERATHTFERAGAEPLSESSLSDWVELQIAGFRLNELHLSPASSHPNGYG
jgi:hypothetical protein